MSKACSAIAITGQGISLLLLCSVPIVQPQHVLAAPEQHPTLDKPHAHPATTVTDWRAQIEADLVKVTNVQIEATAAGLSVQLNTAAGQLTTPQIKSIGNQLIAEIDNAILEDPQGFQSIDPAPDITEVTVIQATPTQIRVQVTGVGLAPIAQVTVETEGLALIVTPTTDEAETEITVTAERSQTDYFAPQAAGTRTDTALRDIPQSIQVLPKEVLKDQQITRLDEALRNVSGITGDTTEGAGFQFSLRGFSAAKVLRNGFSLSGSDALSNTGLVTLPETANLEQIEVLKGPSSILYGEINPGGVINLVTKTPTSQPLYEAEVQVGSRTFFRPRIDFSDALTQDGQLRYRLNALIQRDEGFRDYDQNIQREFVAPVLSWDIGERTNLTLDFEYLHDQRPNDSGLLAFGRGVVDVPRERIVGEPDDVVDRDFITTGYTFKHQFNDNWSVRSAFRYSKQDYLSNFFLPLNFNEATGLVARINGSTDWFQDYLGLQTEVTGKFKTGPIQHTLLFGVDLSQDRSDIDARVNFAPSLLDIFNPVYGTPTRLSFNEFATVARAQDVTTRRLGILLQDQIKVLDNLQFVVGGRYDIVDQQVTNSPSLFDPAGRQGEQTVDAFTPRVGVVYQPIPELSLYSSYAQSFTPSASTTAAGDFLVPETGEGFEVGLKAEVVPDKLFATLAYFNITKQNVATPDPNALGVFNAFVATGEQQSQGIELDLSGEILPGWNVIASYAYTDAEVTQDNVIPIGNQLTGIPKHSANLWTTYTLQQGDLQGLGFGIGFTFASDRQGDLNNSFVLNDYFITNAAIFYQRQRLRLAVNFKNIFNVNYIQGTPISRIRGIEPGEPFTVIGSITYQF